MCFNSVFTTSWSRDRRLLLRGSRSSSWSRCRSELSVRLAATQTHGWSDCSRRAARVRQRCCHRGAIGLQHPTGQLKGPQHAGQVSGDHVVSVRAIELRQWLLPEELEVSVFQSEITLQHGDWRVPLCTGINQHSLGRSRLHLVELESLDSLYRKAFARARTCSMWATTLGKASSRTTSFFTPCSCRVT